MRHVPFLRKDDVVFRGSRRGLSVVLNEGPDFAGIATQLQSKLDAAGQFVAGAEVTLEVGDRVLMPDQIEKIQTMLHAAGGLVLKEIIRKSPEPPPLPRKVAEAVPPPVPPLPPRTASEGETTRVDSRTLRSGQSITHRGTVIILGDVNPGAEVVATGHIVVMGALRGVAHAGADGDTNAVVVAVKLRPTQLRIGNIVGRPPDSGQDGVDAPEVARVRDGVIVLETPHGGH